MKPLIRLAALAVITVAGLAPALSPQQVLASAASPAAPGSTAPGSTVPGGALLWAARYRDHTPQNFANGVVASPDGSTVYVAGTSDIEHTTLVAYNAATGARRWVSHYYGLGDSEPFSLAISPDGSRLFTSGFTTPPGAALPDRFAVVAYDAATGAVLWARHPFVAGLSTSMTVSPDGSTVYATGLIERVFGGAASVVTIAYDAATGARKWLASYHASPTATAASVTASPDGRNVFVSTPVTSSGTNRIATLAYNAATGAPLWTRLVNGSVSAPEGIGIGRNVAVSPDSSAVFVTGYVAGPTGDSSFATIAYRAGTGTRLWERFYHGPAGASAANAIAVSPDGQAVYVTGRSGNFTANLVDYVTVGYAAVSGARLWARSYQPPAGRPTGLNLGARAVGVSPGDGLVFITGGTPGAAQNSLNFTTIAYRAGTGATAWLARFAGVQDFGYANSLAVGPAGQVYVTGAIGASDGCCDFGTVAYQP
jgi:outer membrane protein assembly factor BamB